MESIKSKIGVSAPQKTFASEFKFPTVDYKKDPVKTMKALQWFGNEDVRVQTVPKPMITDPGDMILRVTSSTICGSDLHMYHSEVKDMRKGDILGHEFMGIVEEIGPDVKTLKVGDRVVCSFLIIDGKCNYCKMEQYSCCDGTNPSTLMESIYGHRISAAFGYSHLTGGYAGGQAEFVRVPLADNNTLKVPEHLPDEKVLFLSDIVSTGWHANELGKVGKGDVVAIWGCGPVGLMAAAWAKFRGAARVISIDNVPYRLDTAKNKIGVEVINFNEKNVVETLQAICPGGPDVCIDAVGFRFPTSLAHKLQRALYLETDAPSIINEMVRVIRKGGRISLVGDYFGTANQFPIGPFMEKSLSMAGGQTHVQKYWKELLGYIERGEFDPTFVITHHMSLDKADECYRIFDRKEDNMLKVVLKPSSMHT